MLAEPPTQDAYNAAEGTLKERKADNKAKRKRERAAEEDRDHTSGKLGNFAEVAAQQHDENHRVQ